MGVESNYGNYKQEDLDAEIAGKAAEQGAVTPEKGKEAGGLKSLDIGDDVILAGLKEAGMSLSREDVDTEAGREAIKARSLELGDEAIGMPNFTDLEFSIERAKRG